ncbi:MAG: succinate dehydrogenase, cytochrome b556 subunit [Gammaproteobacteria bacterium]|nr:succinate dehydrogenase, cytochrome b556 subunit [Gammaproteobacteria bacterium]
MITQDNRPMSPHVQIYRLPLTALLSITHRFTGVVLSFGALLMVWILACIAGGAESYASIYSHLAAWYGQLFLFGFTFALYFHFCHGLRHLFWDMGWGFDLEIADRNALLTIAASVGLTLVTWAVALMAG